MMMLTDAIIFLVRELDKHGNVEIRTGGVEGDEISDVWSDPDIGCVYIG